MSKVAYIDCAVLEKPENGTKLVPFLVSKQMK